jgi:hypothetical protein
MNGSSYERYPNTPTVASPSDTATGIAAPTIVCVTTRFRGYNAFGGPWPRDDLGL